MRTIRAVLVARRAILPAIALALAGCPDRTDRLSTADVGPVDSGGSGEDSGARADSGASDAEADAPSGLDRDGDTDEEPASQGCTGGDVLTASGPVTYVLESAVLSTERPEACDLDGIGGPDNSIADMGPAAEIAAGIFGEVFNRQIERGYRLLLHMPWVEVSASGASLAGPLIVARGHDVDDPADPSDDFAGEELYEITGWSLDGCGEPLCHALEGTYDGCEMRAELSCVLVPIALYELLLGYGAKVLPRSAGPGRLEVRVCLYVRMRDIGGTEAPDSVGTGYSMLELFVAGGALMGMDFLPGARPDIDLDFDGLEDFILDEEAHVVACIDGDGTIIDGPDCWMDERIADAVSLVADLSMVRALAGGRQEGWQGRATGACTDPPERSLFDLP